MRHQQNLQNEKLRTPAIVLASKVESHGKRIFCVCLLACLSSGILWSSNVYATDLGPGVGIASVLKALLALTLVLVAVFGIAWIGRRFSPAPHAGNLLKLRGGLALGTRERVVIVEVKDTWLVVGVAPGQVSVLHTLPRPEEASHEMGSAIASGNFSSWLGNAIKRQTHA